MPTLGRKKTMVHDRFAGMDLYACLFLPYQCLTTVGTLVNP